MTRSVGVAQREPVAPEAVRVFVADPHAQLVVVEAPCPPRVPLPVETPPETPVVESTRWDACDYVSAVVVMVALALPVAIGLVLFSVLVPAVAALYSAVVWFMGLGPWLAGAVVLGVLVALGARIPLSGLVSKAARVRPERSVVYDKPSVAPVRSEPVVKEGKPARLKAAKSVRVKNAASVKQADEPVKQADELTQRWLAVMRDPCSRQARGELRESVQDENGATIYYTGAKCAGGWLIEAAGGRYDRQTRNMLKRKYGMRLLRQTARMNDRGASLSKVADFVEHQRRG